jgi:hypothetical protein
LEAYSQEQRVDPGAKTIVERSRTIEHTVTLESRAAIEAGLNVDLLEIIKIDVLGKIERRLEQSFKESETYRQSVELDGNKSRKWKVVWYDKVWTGIARCTDGSGEVYELPYRFTVVSDLEAIAMD